MQHPAQLPYEEKGEDLQNQRHLVVLLYLGEKGSCNLAI